jgi:hypothetical protein
MRVPVSRLRPPWPAGLLSSRRSCAGRRSRPGWRVRVRRHGSACCASRDRLGPGPCVTVRRRRARGGGSCGAPATVVRRRSLSCGLTTTTAPTCGRRIRAISPALPVTSNATRSVGSRLDANNSTAAGVDSIRTRRTDLARRDDHDLAKVTVHVHPDRPEHGYLLVIDDAGAQVGKRHRRIRARGTTGPVAGAATENPGLSAHQS